MRKDRIEERIAGIERDVKELRSEVRQEIMSMSSELKEAQQALVEDMMSDIQDTMSGGYRQIAYELSISGAEKRFREQMSYNCPPGDNREECIDHFVCEHLRKGIVSLDSAPSDMEGEVRKEIIDRDDREGESFKGTPCEYCQGIYVSERDRLLEMGEKFSAYRKSLYARRSRPYYRQLPDDLTVSELIDPLSHRARFVMLKNLTSGGMSFRELGDVTGYQGGHLIYHLNKLVSAGLVSKEDSGLYAITDKGIGVMEVIRKMYGGPSTRF
jgi:DNA-binding HxlR family transcriptional regulator